MVQTADQQDVKSLTEPAPAPKSTEPRPAHGLAALWFAWLLLAAASAGGGYWLFQQLAAQTGQLQQLSASDRQGAEALARLTESAGRLQADWRQAAQQAELRWQQQDQQVQARLDEQARQLAGMTASSRVSFELNEALFLLRQASQRLQLERAPDSPVRLLQLTDQMLAGLATELGSPAGLLAVRGQLAKDLSALQSVQAIDLGGRYFALDSLMVQLDALPVAQPPANFEAVQSAPDGAGADGLWASFQAAWRSFLAELTGFVRLRKTDAQAEPLLAPEQADNLRANIRLRLQVAQWALLRAEAGVYRSALESAAQWLDRYYPGSPARAALAADLSRLADAPVIAELPDIAASHRALEAFRNQWLREVQP